MAALALTDAMPEDPEQDRTDAGEEHPAVYPGALGPRGVALSGEEAARRYPVSSMAISRWVRSGVLPVAGGYGRRMGQPQPLIWSGDLEQLLEQILEQRGKGPLGTEVRHWPIIVRRAYAERGLGEPPVQATGEGLEELREPLRVWGVCELPSPERLAALALTAEDVRAMYAGLAAGLFARGITPEQLRAAVLALAADPQRLGPLAAFIPAEQLAQLRAAVASVPDHAVLSRLFAAGLELAGQLFAILPATSAMLQALAGHGPLLYTPETAPAPADLPGEGQGEEGSEA